MKKKKKIESPKQEVRQDYYNYEKIFLELITDLNKCETKSELDYFLKLSEGFKKQGASKTLTNYLDESIQNKITSLKNKQEINYTKLRSFNN